MTINICCQWTMLLTIASPFSLIIRLLLSSNINSYSFSEEEGSLTNTVSSSKNSIKSFNDSCLWWLLYSISAFLFHLSATSFGNFENNIHSVRCLHSIPLCCCSKTVAFVQESKNVSVWLCTPIFYWWPILYFISVRCIYSVWISITIPTAFLVTSLHFGIQDVLVVEHKALWAPLLHHLYI